MRQLVVWLAVIGCRTAVESGPPHARVGWRESAALDHLRIRAVDWLDHRPCALSCHTTHPFLLADGESPARDRVIARVTERLDQWTTAEPWYDSDRDKVSQSRATEAVLNAFALAGSSRAAPAIDAMINEQRGDGGWAWLDFGLAPWELRDAEPTGAALAAIAFARAKLPPTASRTRAIDALHRFVAGEKRRPTLSLHDKLALLWADRWDPAMLTDDEAHAYTAAVRDRQHPDGGWGLGELGEWRRKDGSPNRGDDSDGYATAFVAFVLGERAEPTAARAIAAARCWLVDHQQADGGWRGRSMNDDDDFNRQLMSDAATAFAILALRAGSCSR